MPQESLNGVLSLKGAYSKFQWSFKKLSRMFLASSGLKRNFRKVLRVFQESFKGVYNKCQGNFKGISSQIDGHIK